MSKRHLLALLVLGVAWLQASCLLAQRDPPVFHSCLPRINLFKERTQLDFEFTFQKAGGPREQAAESQAYVFGYLEKDETRILELAANKERTSKNKPDGLFLDELLSERLVVQLDTKVASQAQTPLLISPQSGRTIKSDNCYEFEFSFAHSRLFEAIGSLKNFDRSNFVDSDNRYFNDKFKLLIFVPVNDCKYATLVPAAQRNHYDFAHFIDSETAVQYCKPLPYRFQFKVLQPDETVLLYVD